MSVELTRLALSLFASLDRPDIYQSTIPRLGRRHAGLCLVGTSWRGHGTAGKSQNDQPSPRLTKRKTVIQFGKYLTGGSVYFWSGYAIFAALLFGIRLVVAVG